MSDLQLLPDELLPPTSLDELPARLRDACRNAGWTSLMPVQAKAMPYLFAGRDMMVQSRTGSGKTGGFVLPILDRVNVKVKACQALILAPTRELAKQVEREADILAGDSGVRTVAVYGGTSYGPQVQAFERGAHVVVGTPGRILDHLLRGTLSLDAIEMLVLDEADRLLSMGFDMDMLRVKSYLPRRRVSTYLFSATFPPHVMRLARQFLTEPRALSLSTDAVHVTDVLHVYYPVRAQDKDRDLVRVLEIENPAAAIIFCNTKRMVHYVTQVLQAFGWDADELSADLTQRDRERVLQRVRDGTLRILVSTNVAARGIDIPDLSHVIQYEPPEDPEAYIHRAGRTGRAGASGRAITLAATNNMERIELRRIQKQFDIDIKERAVPSDEEVETVVSQRITAQLEAEYRTRRSLDRERLERLIPLARQLCDEEDETVLLAMVLDDWYQRKLRAGRAEAEEDAAEKRRPKKARAPAPRAEDAPASAGGGDESGGGRRPRGGDESGGGRRPRGGDESGGGRRPRGRKDTDAAGGDSGGQGRGDDGGGRRRRRRRSER